MKSRNEFTTRDEYDEYLRIYFAGLCLQGILANPSINNIDLSPTKSMIDALKVEFSIRMANELLKQLDNEPTTNISDI